jgi:hypothetical protein
MLRTGLLFSIFPDFERAFGDRNPLKKMAQQYFLSLFGLVDQLNKMNRPVSESTLFALFLIPFIHVITPEHPFLGKREQHHYHTQAIRWASHQIMNRFSFPRGIKETASQILIAQSILKKALQRGFIPKKLKRKGYFQEAVLLYGIKAQTNGERVPRLLRNAVSSDLLPWWPKELKRRHRRSRWRGVPQNGTGD